MAEGLLNALWRSILSQSATATTEVQNNESEVCRRLILSALTIASNGTITAPTLAFGTATVNSGGTGVTTLANHGVIVGQGTSPVAVTTPGTTGQVLTGVTGADPSFQALAAVTSVAQTVPVEFAIAGSPVTTTGTLAITKATQTANTVWAGPAAGGAVVPAFRALVVADLPVTDVPHGGTGVATLAAHGVVVGNAAGVVAVTSAGTAGQVLTSQGAAADPIFTAAPWSLLKAGNGSDTSAGATTVDSIALTGLTANDRLHVFYSLTGVTANTAQVVLYSVTDAATVVALSPSPLVFGDASAVAGTATLGQRQGSATQVVGINQGMIATPARNDFMLFTTPATAWTGSWTLGLRHGGVTATGTLKWSWAVYKSAGQ